MVEILHKSWIENRLSQSAKVPKCQKRFESLVCILRFVDFVFFCPKSSKSRILDLQSILGFWPNFEGWKIQCFSLFFTGFSLVFSLFFTVFHWPVLRPKSGPQKSQKYTNRSCAFWPNSSETSRSCESFLLNLPTKWLSFIVFKGWLSVTKTLKECFRHYLLIP